MPQIPHDAVAMKWRSATREASKARDRRTSDVSSGWFIVPGSPVLDPAHLRALDEALGAQEADRELVLVARRAHRHGHCDRFLVRPGGPDLERLLADDAIGTDLERVAADRDDPSS